jgi:enoyl-CoA hydratase/carnithine racemase
MRVMEKLFLMGGWLGATEAHQLQFVQRVVPEDELVDEARRWAAQLALIPSSRFGHGKDQIRRSYELMGLSSVHAAIARYGPPREGRSIEAALHEGGIAAALRQRDEGIDDDISRV